MRRIKEIIVHCTATFPGQRVTVEDIRRWHKQRGFKDIGYHYVVDTEGNEFIGRLEEVVGAHCIGHNAQSIGVCYVGGLDADGRPADTRTKEQKNALFCLLKRLKKRYPDARIIGHRDVASRFCPCFDAAKEYEEL